MDPFFYTELALSFGSIAVLSWKIAGWSDSAPATAAAALKECVPSAVPAQASQPAETAASGIAPPAEVDFLRLRWALSSEQLPVRLAAAAELSLVPGPEAVEAMRGLLRDPSYEIRRLAVQRLGAEKSAAYTESLLAAARDVRIEVQNAACEALVGNRDPRVRDLFRRMSLQGLHYAQILGLRGLGAAGGEEKLLVEIARGSVGRIRDEAIVALAGSSTTEALETVRDFLKTRLEQSGAGAAREPVDEGQFRQLLDQEPSLPLIEEVECGLDGLSPLRRKGEVLARLWAIAQNTDADERRRYLAVRGLGFLGGLPLLAKLEEAASDPVTAVRFGAAIALGKLRSVRVVPTLKRCLADASFLVRGASIVFLSQLGSIVERAVFEGAAADADPFIRQLANRALASRKPEPGQSPEPAAASEPVLQRAMAVEAPPPAIPQAVESIPEAQSPFVVSRREALDLGPGLQVAPRENPAPVLLQVEPSMPAAGLAVSPPVAATGPAPDSIARTAPASMVRSLLARTPRPAPDRALEKLLQPLRAVPPTRAPAGSRPLGRDGRRLTLSEVLRGAV